MTNREIAIIVNRYIGVEGGYLGDFSYRTHADFYTEYCDLDVDPSQCDGITRERFQAIGVRLSQTKLDALSDQPPADRCARPISSSTVPPRLRPPSHLEVIRMSLSPVPAARVSEPLAVIYCRVSTKDQANRGGEAEDFSIPAQREACLRKAEALGL